MRARGPWLHSLLGEVLAPCKKDCLDVSSASFVRLGMNLIFLTSSARTSMNKHTRDQKARKLRPERGPGVKKVRVERVGAVKI